MFIAHVLCVGSCGRHDMSMILLCPTPMKVESTVYPFQAGKLKFRADEKCVEDLTGGSRHWSQDLNTGLSGSIPTLSDDLLSVTPCQE